jgi:YD repeat-containing protein
LKPEITQKVKLVHTLNTTQDLLASQSSAVVTEQASGLAKVTALFVNHRSRTSAVMLGLAVLVGITSFPTNYVETVAVAAESATPSTQPGSTTDRYVEQLRNDVAGMQARHTQKLPVLIAQAITPRASLSPVANRANPTSLQFGSEAAVSIDVSAPKTKVLKPAPTGQAYSNQGGYETDATDSEDRPGTTQTGTTTIGFSWPAAGKLTSRYGRRWGRMHKGIDIAGPVGTPINTAADGTVITAGWHSGGFGNLVEVRHSDGTTTRYAHNSRISVSVGQTVRQGQQVAEMGSTGRSTGSHLHFEIRPSGGSAVNPIAHLPANS